MLIAIAAIAVSALTSCGKDDDVVIIEKEVVKSDTVKVVDTICTGLELIDYRDLWRIIDYFLSKGEGLNGVFKYEEFVNSYDPLPVHQYLVWLGYVSQNNHERFLSYTIHSDERTPKNRQQLIQFEDDVVTPAREYVQSFKDLGYGGSHYSTWLDPETFLPDALKGYQGEDPYGYLLMLEEISRNAFLFGI